MADFFIEPSQLEGSLYIPSSKSHTLRSILFAALAEGESRIEDFLPSPDTEAMIQAVCLLGADVKRSKNILQIQGVAGKLRVSKDVIQCGNSGQVLRFIGAIAGLIPQYTILTGDASIRSNRPIKPLLSALEELGAFAVSSKGDGYAPIIVKGPFLRQMATLDGQDSQPISGLLIAGAFASYPIELRVVNPGEKPWIDLTLDWLQKLKIPYVMKDYRYYRVEGKSQICGFQYRVPGDFSSAAFAIAAALLTHSQLTICNLDMRDIQGDKKIVPILQEMGAVIHVDERKRTLTVEKGGRLKGAKIDVNDVIDALPILAVIGCFAEGKTELVNGRVAREKESDRIASIAKELKKMGAHIEEKPDGLIIEQSKLYGAQVESHHDHRIALSLSIAAMAAERRSTIQRIECIDKTYPSFLRDFQSVGAKIQS